MYIWCMTVSVRKCGWSFMPITLCVCLMFGVQLPGKAVKEGALSARHDAIPRSEGERCKGQEKAPALTRARSICAEDRRASPANGTVVPESTFRTLSVTFLRTYATRLEGLTTCIEEVSIRG